MNEHTQKPRDGRFVIGLLTGTVVGVGLMAWLAPRTISELRQRMTASAKRLAKRASAQCEETSARVGEAVEELTRRGQEIRVDVADTVARGAHEVERGAYDVAHGAHEVAHFANAAKTDGGAGAMKHSAAHRAASTPRSL